TARGYRKSSHGFKNAIVQATGQAHMRSISTVLASQAVMTGEGPVSDRAVRAAARNPDQYMRCERYGYLTSARKAFKDQRIVSLCADGVHVGDEDWLNVAMWSPERECACFLPPQ
ncbi:unnamed protein product, partial [Cladocopium goreaui]